MDKQEVPISLFRSMVEDIPRDGLGLESEWNWKPDVPVNRTLLSQNSPTTEYSSKEDDE